MVRPEVIHKRLGKVDEYLTILKKIQRYPLDEFLADPEKYGSAERFLQLTIEALNDIGSHLVADLNLGIVDSAGDIPRLLCEKGYFGEELREIWIRMIGFRNILVHDYLDVDRRVVHEVLQKNITDVQSLMRVFARFL
ncbi:MAG: DUF86 domain-containing protein [bacterium]|jgi:uncharacterized protein YutE (UPF0331/DUF86 family)